MALHLARDVLKMAKDSGTEIKGYEAGVEHMRAAKNYYEAGGRTGEGEISGIYGAVRAASGMAFENDEGSSG